jgi:hypothetical protein
MWPPSSSIIYSFAHPIPRARCVILLLSSLSATGDRPSQPTELSSQARASLGRYWGRLDIVLLHYLHPAMLGLLGGESIRDSKFGKGWPVVHAAHLPLRTSGFVLHTPELLQKLIPLDYAIFAAFGPKSVWPIVIRRAWCRGRTNRSSMSIVDVFVM